MANLVVILEAKGNEIHSTGTERVNRLVMLEQSVFPSVICC